MVQDKHLINNYYNLFIEISVCTFNLDHDLDLEGHSY